MSRQIIPMHGKSHCPGGSDPIPCLGLPWAYGVQTGAFAVAADAVEVEWETFSTNAPGTFELDTVGSSGILVFEPGLYLAAGAVEVVLGDVGVARTTYTQVQFASSYPTFGTEFGWDSLVGPYALDTSLYDTTQQRQNHHAFGLVVPDAADPMRAVLVANRPAGNYTLNHAGLVLVKIGGQ